MTYFIYIITNNLNGKIYIGKTNDLQKRWHAHVYCALVEKKKLYFSNAIRKYGAKNFSMEIIDECPSEELALEREIYWIDFLKSRQRDIGYNMTNGGDGVSGLKHTEESKNKQRVKMLGRKHTDETKIKMSEAHKGQVVSLETREKISQANSGENNGMYGKSISDETRILLSKFQSSRSRKPLTEEHKQKNREATTKQDRSFKISTDIKNEVVQLYGSGNYTKKQLSEKFGLKYNSVVKIIRTHKST
jgi:predicted GIY-YIG superfamily endonuclease